MKVEPMSNTVVTVRALQDFADALPAWMDQRQHATIVDVVERLVPIIDARTDEAVARALVPTSDTAPTIDADAIRSEIVEAAVASIAATLPQLVEAARADSISEVVRDRDGRIEKVKTRYRAT